jgi:biopolymer transport protein ExbD
MKKRMLSHYIKLKDIQMQRLSPARSESEPMSAINTTPLIDVLLVLLIMMIMSLPSPMHKVGVDLPREGDVGGTPPPVHRLTITDAGSYLWDGNALPDAALSSALLTLKNDPAVPLLHMETSPAASYQRFDETIALVKQAGINRVGFIGNPPVF